MFKPFRAATWSNWKDAFSSHIYILLGSLLPIWFTPIILKLLSSNFFYTDIIDHGEFALYAAALITPPLYLILKDRQISAFPYRIGFVILSIIVLIISAGLFSGVIVSAVAKSDIFILDKKFLRYTTISLLFLSIILSYLVSVLDNSLMPPDLSAIKEKEIEDLENKFDKTEKQ